MIKDINEPQLMNEDLFNFNGLETILTREVKHFFDTAPYAAKLVFFRDAQSKGFIFDNQELKLFLKEQLVLLKLRDEAVRISYPE